MKTIKIETVTAPTAEPVDVGEVRSHIKASSADDNSVINDILVAAREYIEAESGLVMINTKLKWSLDSFGNQDAMPWWDGIREGSISEFQATALELPRGPVQSIESITTYDDSDVATVWNAANYMLDKPGGRIVPRAGVSWPTFSRVANGIEIVFVAGHGDEPKNIPSLAKLAIKMQCAHLYQHRGDAAIGVSVEEIPRGVMDLIERFKIKSLK